MKARMTALALARRMARRAWAITSVTRRSGGGVLEYRNSYHEGRTPTPGYAESREAAMQAFAKGWHRE
jgi:hypothetical protein